MAVRATDFVDKIAFYDILSDSEKTLVKNNVTVRHYKKGELIHTCTGECLGMIHVISGVVRVSVISEEGRELTLYKLNEGDTCVISAICVLQQIKMESSITASTDTDLLILSASAISKLVEDNINVKCYSYELATKRFSTALFVLQNIILSRFDRRLAKYLLDVSQKKASTKLQITQEQIAEDISSAREVVARMLKLFALENIVEIKRGSIEIKDMEKLKAVGK